jgi:hypothetical protein
MIEIGNTTALAVLLGWPVITAFLFRHLPLDRALIWSILAAYMFMPQLSAIDLPIVPPLNKETIPNLAAFAACMVVLGRRPTLVPEGNVGRILLVLFIVSPAITVLNNLEPIQFGVDRFGSLRLVDPNELDIWGLPGLRIYDSASALVNQLFLMLPFFVARTVLRSEAAIREILVALVIAGTIYALPMLWEVRFSPQLHTRLYGFFQHDFQQAIRNGGFRPFVFMPHGLWVAFFAFMCAMAAAGLARTAARTGRGKRLLFVGFMIGLVVICKSLGSLLLTLVFVPIVLILKARTHLLISAILVVIVLAYPMLRGSGMVPTDAILERVESIDPERRQSLEYRFTNEDRILHHVSAKPLFGWGGWGRFMVYDRSTGEAISIVDGQWVITIGHYGWLGYIAMFGLLALPVLSVWWQARKPEAPPVPLTVSTLVLILAVNMVDLLPNATLIPFTWLIAGALLGYAETLKQAVADKRAEQARARQAGIILGQTSGPIRKTRGRQGPRTVL